MIYQHTLNCLSALLMLCFQHPLQAGVQTKQTRHHAHVAVQQQNKWATKKRRSQHATVNPSTQTTKPILLPTTRSALYHAHKKHFSQPYKHMRLSAHCLRNHKGQSIMRRNHSIAHAFRVCSYVRPMYQAFSRFGSATLKPAGKKQAQAIIQRVELAAAYNVSGRESEVSSSNRALYQSYRNASARNFIRYVSNDRKAFAVFNNDKQLVRDYAHHVIAHRGKANKTTSKEIQLASKLLARCHDLDLLRCKGPSTMRGVNKNLDKFLQNDHKHHQRKQLNVIARKRILASGDHLSQPFSRNYNAQQLVKLARSAPGYSGNTVKNFNSHRVCKLERALAEA